MTFPIYDLALAPPGRMTAPQIVGSAVEGGRTLSGLTSAADLTGGGLVSIKYGSVQLRNSTPAAQRYWSWLSAYLAGGVRSILVPLLTDYIIPAPAGYPPRSAPVPHRGGAFFSNGAGYSIKRSMASFAAAASLNGATVSLRLGPGLSLMGGEWFEVAHPARASRAYCVTEIDGATANGDGTTTYLVGIRPPLREAVDIGAPINFDRPKCVMRLAPGTAMPNDVEKFWQSSPEVSFVESFGRV